MIKTEIQLEKRKILRLYRITKDLGLLYLSTNFNFINNLLKDNKIKKVNPVNTTIVSAIE